MVDVEKRILQPDLLEKARVELNEIQSEVPGHIEALRKRILEDPNLNFRTDDNFLLRFLRARKFDQDRAFELMSKYYRVRQDYPNVFNKSKSDLQKVLDLHVCGVLSNRDEHGRSVLLFLCEKWDTNQASLEELMFHYILTLELLVEDDEFQINGTVWIYDLTAFSLSQAAEMSPWKMKEAVAIMLNSFPLRLKAGHYVNESIIFDGVFMLVKPFLSRKIQERVVFHGNCLPSLHEYVSPEILPEELGGDLDLVDFSEWNERLLQNFDRLIENLKYGFLQPE